MADVSLPENILNAVDIDKEISLKKPVKLDVPQLIQLYKDKGIPEHRFGFTQIHKIMEKGGSAFIEKGAVDVKAKAAVALTNPLIDIGFDAVKIPDIIGELIPLPMGDTTYEDLRCIGLNTNQDVLAGVIKVKKTCGYSGNLCSAGSDEYVAFWIDWDDGAGWTYVGTASVNVHDIDNIPPEGLQYSVFLPVNLSGHRQPCGDGAKTVKVRAILSWEVAPPTWSPYYIPRWGNRRDTLVHITPGPALEEGDHTPYISVVGNMGIDDIDSSTGLATGTGVMAAFTANDSPFGGVVTISGHIAFPPNSFVTSGSGATPLKYKVFVRQSLPGEPWQQLTNSFNIKLVDQVGSTFSGPNNHKQMIDPNGYYTYMEDLDGNERRFVEGFVLAKWATTASMTGIWEIRMEAFDTTTSTTYPALNTDGTPQVIRIKIDNVWPVPAIEITGYTRAGVTKPAEACGSFRKGDIIHGTYSMQDEHFLYLSLWAEPTAPASGGKLCAQPGIAPCTPASGWSTPPSVTRFYPSPVASTNGESGVWSLDTAGMTPCGYILRVHGSDRTIVDSGYIGHKNGKSVGFCLLKPE
jgi:DNA uptake protein ComE-like DNA-binding protein